MKSKNREASCATRRLFSLEASRVGSVLASCASRSATGIKTHLPTENETRADGASLSHNWYAGRSPFSSPLLALPIPGDGQGHETPSGDASVDGGARKRPTAGRRPHRKLRRRLHDDAAHP